MKSCERCGRPCEVYDGESYCPDCTRYEPAPEPWADRLFGVCRPALLALLLLGLLAALPGRSRAANQTVQVLNRAGLGDLDTVAVSADVGGTDSWTQGSGSEYVYVNNGNAGSLTVTLQFNGSLAVDGQVPASRTVTVAAGKRYLIGPFPTTLYNSGSNATVTIGWSVTSGVKVLVFRATPNQ